MSSTRKFTAWALFWWLLCLPNPVLSGNGGQQIRIKKVSPYLKNDKVFMRLQLEAPFPAKVSSTIQSGMPVLLSVECRIFGNGDELRRLRIMHRITYNIWDERFTCESQDTARTFHDFEQLMALLTDKMVLRLMPGSVMRNVTAPNVRVRAGVTLITRMQSRKLAGWLENSDAAGSRFTTDERSSGFKMNISKLVSWLISDRDNTAGAGEWQNFPLTLANSLK